MNFNEFLCLKREYEDACRRFDCEADKIVKDLIGKIDHALEKEEFENYKCGSGWTLSSIVLNKELVLVIRCSGYFMNDFYENYERITNIITRIVNKEFPFITGVCLGTYGVEQNEHRL